MNWAEIIAMIIGDVVGGSLNYDAAQTNASAQSEYMRNTTELSRMQLLRAILNMKATEAQIASERKQLTQAIAIRKNLNAFQQQQLNDKARSQAQLETLYSQAQAKQAEYSKVAIVALASMAIVAGLAWGVSYVWKGVASEN